MVAVDVDIGKNRINVKNFSRPQRNAQFCFFSKTNNDEIYDVFNV